MPSPGLDMTSYDDAVIHLAFDIFGEREGGHFSLLFALVELFPDEIPAPDTTKQVHSELQSSPAHRLFTRHVKTDVATALEWYQRCAHEEFWLYPDGDDEFNFADEDLLHPFGETFQEPEWPTMILQHSYAAHTVPFIPTAHCCPRVHHLLTPNRAPANWGDDVRGEKLLRAVEVIRQELSIDLEANPSLWNSVHLIAPNPVLRRVGVRGVGVADGDESTGAIAVFVEPRAKRTVDELDLTLLVGEHRATGDTGWALCEVREPEVTVELGYTPDHLTALLYSDEYGLLYRTGPTTWETQLNITMKVSASSRRVTTERTDGSVDEYKVPTHTPQHIQVGSSGPPLMRKLMRIDEEERRRRTITQPGSRQRWFSGNADEATEELRDLLADVQQDVLIVDPYFGAEQLSMFALAVSNLAAKVRVLTSAEFLKKKELFGAQAGKNKEFGDQLNDALEQLKTQSLQQEFDIRVMPGKRPEIHDRFICRDEEVWLLGSSLNEFGSRGTVLVQLPEPTVIKSELEQVFARRKPSSDGGPVLPFHEWHLQRVESRREEE